MPWACVIQRNQALTELAKLIDITVTEQPVEQ